LGAFTENLSGSIEIYGQLCMEEYSIQASNYSENFHDVKLFKLALKDYLCT
jgi:hypothetical protein